MITDNGIEYDDVQVTKEVIPCGEAVTTCYLLGGQVVRQDVNINVSSGVLLDGIPGQIGA